MGRTKSRRGKRKKSFGKRQRRVFSIIRDTIGKDAEKRGIGTERYILHLLQSLAAEERIPCIPEQIRRTERYSEEDRAQIDIVITTDCGDIPIQVKSSRKAAEEFRKTYPKIFCIAAPRSDPEIEIEKRLLRGILRKYKALLAATS